MKAATLQAGSHHKFTSSLITKNNEMMKHVILSLICIAIFSSCNDTLRTSDTSALVPATVIEDSSMPSIEINGIRLHSITYGDPSDPMILVIHGGPGADHRSQLNFKMLADDGYYVVFYDQMGSGLSERLDANAYSSVQLYIDELEGVIKYYKSSQDQQVVLAGHSWGAMLAIAFTNQNPNEVEGIILAEPGGFTWEQTEAYIKRSGALKLLDESTNDFVYQDQFITGNDHNTLDYKLSLSLAGDSKTGDDDIPSFWRYGAVCNSASIELVMNNPEQLDFTSNIKDHVSKILFAYSERNLAYGKEHAELLSDELLHVELKEISGCGHEIPEFGWSNFYPIVSEYLNEVL